MKSIFTLLLLTLPFFGNSQECYSRCLVAKLKVSQMGTEPPIVTHYYNPNSYTLTTFRDGVGTYRIDGFTGQSFTNGNFMYEMEINATLTNNGSVDIYPSTSTSFALRTFDYSGLLSDNVISATSGLVTTWHVITIWRYKN